METTRPQAAIIEGRKKKEQRETKKQQRQDRKTPKGRRKRKQQQKQLEYATTRKTLISMENGLRTQNIASLNPDPTEEPTTQQEIIKELAKNKIHIDMIQETRIVENMNYRMDNYRIITYAAEKNKDTNVETGGTAVMIRESIQQNIIQIKRQSSRALRVTLCQEKATMPTHAISTYAPHSGHNEETRQQHWKDVQELLSRTSKQHLTIWGADANGQLGNRNKAEDTKHTKQAGQTQSIVGPYAKRKPN